MSATLEYTWIVTCQCGHMFSELCQDALQLCISYARFVILFQPPHSRRWWSHSSTLDWTTERVEFKIAVLTHKVLCSVAPRYLGPLNRVTDISGRRSLRSSGTNRIVVPPFRLSTVGSRAFPVAAAKIWNALPDSLVSITSHSSFRHHLKTFLFQRSFA